MDFPRATAPEKKGRGREIGRVEAGYCQREHVVEDGGGSEVDQCQQTSECGGHRYRVDWNGAA